ncbi:4-(cytidine 5'-diphospho)-2-C-methyl-D-erythritol kinase [Acidihalobacter ferrooxydans]|uniref:4-diphosphocytidyl-2-C-methyl-D-erythritol kinase n=1 Tax=Acidihalobacter ferrooxydans TaxID=1765967 RepID=A0A1P8UGE1_9GAMM|nr:4-(cytidine 5'-diphospho)-2-C-methyl-D-erythritol kinase [Acidihalobacter ferrooxydans]APZ42917.1 4-(cytidine 5'-diphospho)-2-C-methyl-D-erythritol kinase [Acidihalobacter ferrooxydans]
MTDAVWPAPAKLNLFLHIVGRRADGYHLLQTVFQFVDHGDSLRFTSRPGRVIQRIGGASQVPEAEDLCVRAARLLQRATGAREGVAIHLDKRLPLGGGLGGGSSDAATTLVALNALWNTGLSEDDLAGLGLELGADVPVFVRGRAAWAQGVGEHLRVLDALPEPWYVVVCPQVHISTAELFADAKLTRNCPPLTIRAFLRGEGGNVFAPVVRERYQEVNDALDYLGQFSEARLTGTGACVFAAFPNGEEARRVLASMPQTWIGFVARGLNRSPLLDRLQQN